MKANEAPETYPMQFKDKIDEYLWKEHHIIGGCSSSIEEVKYLVAREVAEKLTDAFIKKVKEAFCKATCNGHPPRSTCTSLGTCKEYDNFVKYIKGE